MIEKTKDSRASRDELDVMIVKELEVDARQTTRDLAAKLSISATTVSNRLRRMVNEGAISFNTMTDSVVSGFQHRILCGIQVVPGRAADVAKTLMSLKNIQNIVLTVGRYDLLVFIVFRDSQEHLNWFSNELGPMTSVINVEEMMVLKIVKHSYMYLRGETILYEELSPRHLDESELKLIRELELNPRESIGVLGAKIGLSRQTTAIKLRRLLDEKIVRVVSIIEPKSFGFSIYASIFVKVRFNRLVPIAHALAADKRISHVAIHAGPFNIMLTMIFRDLEEMTSFLMNDLGGIPGVVGHETLVSVGQRYRSFHLLI